MIALLFGCVVAIGSELDPRNRYTVIFDYIAVEPPLYPEDFEPRKIDLETVTVQLVREINNDTVQIEIEEIASEQWETDKTTIEGELNAPIDATILVKSGDDTILSAKTVIGPRDVISVTILDHLGPFPQDQLAFVGSSRQVKNAKNKFTIVGNFTSVDMDVSLTTASVFRVGAYESNNNLGTVLLSDGCFLFEGEIEEPTVVYIPIRTGMEGSGYSAWTWAVVEPGAVIRLAPEKVWFDQLFSTAGTGRHVELIESWLRSEEYRNTFDLYAPFVNKDTPWFTQSEEHFQLMDKLRAIRSRTIDRIARSAEDPMNVLLALEMGALGYGSDTLPLYEKLEHELDEDLVARRVTPAKEAIIARMQTTANRLNLVPGKKAPDFSLPDLNGDVISLKDVLEEYELVLIDFWASWCGPCIAEFPDLKQLYTKFNDHGFEIISVSIDDTQAEWKEASTEQSLPWMNVADIGGFTQSTPKTYGVHYVPKTFLVDNKGYITIVDISTEELKEFLNEKFGSTDFDD